MSYNGKSAAAAVAAILLVYGDYFWWAGGAARDEGSVLARMAGTVVLMVVVMVVLETGIAIVMRRARAGGVQADERDALIGARSARNGYYAMLSVAWLMPLLALSGASGVLVANCLLCMLVLAELVHFGSRVAYDLRGA